MNRCVIFGGGEIADIRYTQNLLQKGDYIICADRGYAYCSSIQCDSDLVLGDFDSYSGKVSPKCEIRDTQLRRMTPIPCLQSKKPSDGDIRKF